MQRGCFLVSSLLIAGMVILAVLAATGRYRVVPVGPQGADVRVRKDALALVEPVPTLRLAPGDVFLARPKGGGAVTIYRVTAIDSFTRHFTVKDPHGKRVSIQLGQNAWRMSGTVPHGGTVFALLVGPIQAAIMLVAGLGLIVWTEIRCRPRGPQNPSAADRHPPAAERAALAGV
jgi:hypothetical protein